MRQRLALTSIAMLVCSLAACGKQQSADRAADVMYIRAGGGVAVMSPEADEPSYKQRKAIPSGDWSTVVRADARGTTTDIVATDPVSDVDRWRDVIRGRYVANVVSHEGDLVALSPAREPYYGYGRAQTKLVIVGDDLEDEHRITLQGNFEPEAFSKDGTSLFVISYLPARSPAKYQVRRLDLASGQVGGVFTPHAELQRAMGGTARIQAASKDGSRLYTLYTVVDGDGERHAFIHVLDLENLWAHCIDLPEGFTEKAERSTALAVSPDGQHVYVANATTGAVAQLDTDTMQVIRTATFDLAWTGKTHAAVDENGMLYIGSGPSIVAIDAHMLEEVDRWAMKNAVTGLQVTEDAASLYVGLSKRVAILDPSGGETTMVDPAGIGRIGQLGPVVEPVDEEPILKCAC